MDYGTLHRGIDAKKTLDSEEDRGLGRRPWTQKKTVDSEEDHGSEVSQMKIEDQEDQV